MLERLLGAERRQYVDATRVLAARYVKVRYRGSVLGVFWSVLNPLIMTCLYGLIFGRSFLPYYGGTWLGYVVAVFVGIVVLNYFSMSTSQALQSVVSNGQLLNKLRLAPSLFPVATVLANSVQFALGVVPLLLVVALIRNPLYAFALVIPAAALLCIAVGVGFMVSAAFVFFRDIPYLWELCVFALFVDTPVFYPLAIVDPRFRPIVEWNPLTMIVQQIRQIVVMQQPPSPYILALLCALAFLILLAGWGVFERARRRFMDYL